MANIPTRTNNPGDLKDPQTGQFRQFSSPAEGFQALKQDLHGKITGNTATGLGPQSTLVDFAKVWAPSSDNNNPEQYAQTLSQKLKTAPTAPLASLDIDNFASAVAQAEGYQGDIPNRMSVSDFASKIKQKYPAYQGLDDNTLTQKVLAKYPQYQHSVEVQPSSISTLATESPVAKGATELGQDLSKKVQEGSEAVGTLASGLASGDVGKVASGALQTVGAAAGGVGDITTKALEVIPGVKEVEGALGSVLGGLANTSFGKSVIGLASDWAKQNPELAKDIGAVGNIASVFPMFKGIGLATGAAKSAVGRAFEGSLAKVAANEMENAITPTLRRSLTTAGKKQGVNVAQDIVDNKAFPDIVQNSQGKNVYSTAAADTKLAQAETMHENDLQNLLKSKSDAPISLKQARDTAIKEARDSMRYDPTLPRVEAQIHTIFDDWEQRFGPKQTLSTLTDMKRDVRSGVKFDTPSAEKDAAYYTGQGLMKSVEDTASSRGIKGVPEINQVMQRIINARRLLSGMEGRAIKTTAKKGSWLKEVGTDVAGGVGEMALSGVPFAGALAGRGLVSRLLSSTPKSALEKLISASARRPSLSQIAGQGLKTGVLRTVGQLQSNPRQ